MKLAGDGCDCNYFAEQDHARRLRRRGLMSLRSVGHLSYLALSASRASCVIYAKNAGDSPMKSPMFVRNCNAPIATPCVLVGRMIETIGRLRSRNGHGSGMIRFVWKSSPPNGGEFRSGKVTDTPVTGSMAVKRGAFPASSDQV